MLIVHGKGNFIAKSHGGGQINISRQSIINELMPLPPYNEQVRSVNRLEEVQKIFKGVFMDWIERKGIIIRIEAIVCIMAVIIALFGGICDALVSNGIVFHYVADLNEVSLTLLQIQAAVTTLTLTIIALLSGNISDSYMGISVSKFYLEERPFILKQKRVIIAEFVMLAISVLSHIEGFYNIVLSLFMASMLLILISILEIYEIFKGSKNTHEEIYAYVEYLFKNEDKYDKYARSFIEDWKELAPIQSEGDFNEYFNLYKTLIDRILDQERDAEAVNSYTEEFSLFLLTYETNKCKIRGIVFINDYYDYLWRWINGNKEKALIIEKPISLLDRMPHEWYMALNEIDAEQFEEKIRFEWFSETVIRVSSWIGFTDKTSQEIASLNTISRSLGNYLSKQKKKGNVSNTKYWESMLSNESFYVNYGIPEDRLQFYEDSLALRDFNICQGMLLSGQTEIVKNGVFLDGLGNLYGINSQEFALRVMLIHCYMFYLGFREQQDCIDEDLQRQIKEMIISKETVNAISSFYNRLDEGAVLLTAELGDKLENILKRYELFPKHSNCKSVIISGVVEEYFLYVALFVERYAFRREILADILNTQKYHIYLMEPNFSRLRKNFTEMHQIFDSKKLNKDEASKRSDEMLASFEVVMKEKYKKDIIEKASISQHDYEREGIQAKVEKKVKELFENKFEGYFSAYDVPCKNKTTYEKVHVFSVLDFTRWLGDENSHDYVDYQMKDFVKWLANNLITDHNFERIKRSEKFKSDDEFRKYLKENEYINLLGSQYSFGCQDYDNYKEHTEFLAEQRCNFISGANVGIALKENSLYLKLNKVYVDVFSPNIDEVDAEKNEETGLYAYSPTQGITLDFEEKELREFLHDERKNINISVNITIGINNNKEHESGVVITRK